MIYLFGEETETGSSYHEVYHNRYITSWMLRKIILPGIAREINFTWETVYHSELRFGPYFGGDILTDYKEWWNETIPVNRNPEHVSAEAEGLLTQYGEYEEVLHLKQISFPGGSFSLNYKSTMNPLLTSVTVRNLNNVIVKNVDFSYGVGLDERLLRQVKFSDEGTYHFEYNPTRFSAGNMNDQDYWGYYNAKANNSLVPRMQVKTYYNRIPGGYTTYSYYGTADRSVDADAMKAYMLTKVIYPTGGYSAFEYEPHHFQGSIPQTAGLGESSRFRLTQGGGLRVTRVSTSAGGDALPVVKTYKYGSNENGLANVIYEPTLDTFIDELSGYSGDIVSSGGIIGYNIRSLFLNIQSNYMRYAVNTPALWYNVVTEYTAEEAKTEYYYQRLTPENQVAILNTVIDFPYKSPTQYNTLFSKGCLLSKEILYQKLNGSYSPVQQTVRNYEVKGQTLDQLSDLVINRMGISMFANGPDFEYSNNSLVCGQYVITGRPIAMDYKHNPCNIRFYYEELESEETIHYTTADSLTERSSYTYSDFLPSSQSIIGSNGEILTESYLYPKDYAQAGSVAQRDILSAMLEKNIKAPIYKKTKSWGGKNEEWRTEFAGFGTNMYKPIKDYYRQNSDVEVCLSEYGYDVAGNLQSHTKNGVLKQTYLWGYKYTVPVAIIQGLSYAETLSLVGQTDIDDLNGYTWNTSSALNSIRAKIGNQGLMTSFLYEPLVGMTEKINPNDEKTTYEYDALKRLKRIKDHNSQVRQHFAYHRTSDEFSLIFETAAAYTYGETLSTTAIVHGGSELYRYVWTLKNSSGTTIYTSSPSESASISIPLQHNGAQTLTCSVTDEMSGEVKTSSRAFNVSVASICFSEVVTADGTVTAKIICPVACSVDFYLMAEMSSPDAYAVFSLKGDTYTLYGGDGQNQSVSLPAGTHTFSISLMSSGGGDHAGLYINSASCPTGIPSSIQITN